MNQRNKVIYISIISATLILFLGLTIFFGVKLFSSVKLGDHYVKTECFLQKTINNPTCYSYSSQCYSQNNQVWWYSYWGPSYFIYVSGGDGYGDDDGEYNDDDGNGGDSGGNDDGGGYDDDDDGGGYDEGDDGGGGWGGEVDGEIVEFGLKSKTTKSSSNINSNKIESTSGAADLSNIREIRGRNKQLKQSNENIQIEKLQDLGSSSPCYFDSIACYQGEFFVQYLVNGQNVTSVMDGLSSVDQDWVSNYLSYYSVNSTYNCYYDDKEPENVIWFEPPKFTKKYLVGFILSGFFLLVVIIAIIIVVKKSSKHSYSRIN